MRVSTTGICLMPKTRPSPLFGSITVPGEASNTSTSSQQQNSSFFVPRLQGLLGFLLRRVPTLRSSTLHRKQSRRHREAQTRPSSMTAGRSPTLISMETKIRASTSSEVRLRSSRLYHSATESLNRARHCETHLTARFNSVPCQSSLRCPWKNRAGLPDGSLRRQQSPQPRQSHPL